MVKLPPPCLLWSNLAPEHIARLDDAPDKLTVQEVITDALKLAPPADGVEARRHEVLLEFFTNLLQFAHKHQMSAEKTSTLFSLLKRTHDEMVETFMSATRTWAFFEALLLAHCVQRPPYSVGIFSKNDMVLATQFALENYFRHFQLFRYAFTMLHVKELCLQTSWIELPPASFPSLADGMPCEASPLLDAASEPPVEPTVEAAASVPATVPEPHFDQLGLPPEVLQKVQDALKEQATAMRREVEQQYSERYAALERQLERLEGQG